jgi:telomere length regulation protein
MLVAEEAARLAEKKLEFDGWEGKGETLNWARDIRRLMKARDVDAELDDSQEEGCIRADSAMKEEIVTPSIPGNTLSETTLNLSAKSAAKPGQNTDAYDSDDSLTGYASPPSSRSPSPSLEDLKEIEENPTLNVGVKKLPRPVYLAQLGELLRGQPGMQAQKPDEPHEADRVEMVLNVAEELIRRKKAYGTELGMIIMISIPNYYLTPMLDENAVNLVYGFLGLQDKYELEGFTEKRQAIVNALVVCAPRKSAP